MLLVVYSQRADRFNSVVAFIESHFTVSEPVQMYRWTMKLGVLCAKIFQYYLSSKHIFIESSMGVMLKNTVGFYRSKVASSFNIVASSSSFMNEYLNGNWNMHTINYNKSDSNRPFPSSNSADTTNTL